MPALGQKPEIFTESALPKDMAESQPKVHEAPKAKCEPRAHGECALLGLTTVAHLREFGSDPIHECLQCATLAACTRKDKVMADVTDVNGTTS